MGLPLEKADEYFTYKEYRTWPDDERWELIHGVPYAMSPAPSLNHQSIVGKIFFQMESFFKKKQCQVFISPVDVLFSKDGDKNTDDIDTIVQPDVVVVCDKKKLAGPYIKGAPDLVVEVLSPSTASKDMKLKFNLYESNGVKEYWVVHPHDKTILVFSLSPEGTYGKPAMYTAEDVIEVPLFEGLTVDLKEVFPDFDKKG